MKGRLVCLEDNGGIIINNCTQICLKEEISGKITS